MDDEEWLRRMERNREFDAMCWGIAWCIPIGLVLLAAMLS
jgi:hypothetical protein